MKKDNFTSDVKTWLAFAEYDLKSAKWQLEGKIYVSACYSSQQAAEKALKTLLLENGKVPPKIHSLDRLVSALKKIKIDVSEIESDARELDTYYITTRYPGQYGGPEGLYDLEDASEAIASAANILTFVKRRLR
ncbi:MAG: HEPN domain-containing protein [Patescibacteria group bacterium]